MAPVGVENTHLANAWGHNAIRRRLTVIPRADRLFARPRAARLKTTLETVAPSTWQATTLLAWRAASLTIPQMKIFLNWSGEESRRVADLLREWLPELFDSVEPWMAADTFGRNNRWLEANSGGFDQAAMIVACITRANIHSDWSSLDPSSFEYSVADIPPQLVLLASPDVNLETFRPIKHPYNVLELGHDGLEILVQQINGLTDRPVQNDVLIDRFAAMWPRFEAKLKNRESRAQVAASVNKDVEGRMPDHMEREASIGSSEIDDLRERLIELTDSFTALRASIVPPTGGREPAAKSKTGKPTVFIGSSVEGKTIAETIQLELRHELETTIWTQGAFPPSLTTMESLYVASRKFDYAVIVMTPDDVTISRGAENRVPRDNLIFEAGLFGGALGRANTFVVYPDDDPLQFPTDFQGVTLIGFTRHRKDNNLRAAVGTACTEIKGAMGLLT